MVTYAAHLTRGLYYEDILTYLGTIFSISGFTNPNNSNLAKRLQFYTSSVQNGYVRKRIICNSATKDMNNDINPNFLTILCLKSELKMSK